MERAWHRFSFTCLLIIATVPLLVPLVAAQAEDKTSTLSTPLDYGIPDELQLLREEETVSIASRYEQPISEAPSNVYVITDEDIRHSGAVDLPTVLRRIPGMEIIQMSGADFNVSIRGDNQLLANKLLVLVDGRSIYIDAQGTTFLKMLPITLPEIKRVEVLKGPASAIYGFNAFDGIINIITKSPEEMKGTTMQIGGGEFGTMTGSAIHAGLIGKWAYRLSAGEEQNQQWRSRDSLAFRTYKFNAHTEYRLTSDSKLTVSGGFLDNNRFDGPTFRGAVVLNSQFVLPYANIAYERPDIFIRAYWNQFNAFSDIVTDPLLATLLRTTDKNGSTRLDFLGNTYNVEAQHTLQLGAHRLTYGFNYRLNTFSGNSITSMSQENRFGVYVQGEWKVASSFTLVAGARYDLHTDINPTISPRISLLYQLAPTHTLRASVSIGYRPPALFDTHEDLSVQFLPPLSPGNTPIRGSHNLHPEQIIAYDVGYQGWYFNHRIRLRGDLFFNHISDLIDTGGTRLTGFNNSNVGEADIFGGEAGIELLVTSWLSGYANYTYQEVTQRAADRGAPRFKVNAGARGLWENGFSAEINYFHVGSATYPIEGFFSLLPTPPDERVSNYNLLNLRAAYRFWQQQAKAGYLRDAEVAVSAFNSLNDKHREHPLGDLIGSRVMGWLTVRY
ncbi:MAG: TonB-dependent receptor [Nitrospira sp.]|nr:TonB-dependent receptor [Nitrospira sp.]